MIRRITGTLAKTRRRVSWATSAVSAKSMCRSSFYNLPAVGERVTLLAHFVVREDAQVQTENFRTSLHVRLRQIIQRFTAASSNPLCQKSVRQIQNYRGRSVEPIFVLNSYSYATKARLVGPGKNQFKGGRIRNRNSSE